MKRLTKPSSSLTTQSGFTIIESLLAIIVVSVLLAAIAPVIMLSAATRVQARRVELATQASRAYVDGVRAGAVAPPNSVVPLDPFDATSPSTDKFFKAAPAGNPLTACIPPGGITAPGAIKTNFYCPPIPTATPSTIGANLFCVNTDSNPKGCSTKSPRSFIIQAFRSALPITPGALTPDPSDDGSKGYLLGVRVYRADAFDGGGALVTSKDRANETQSKVATYTGGTVRTRDRKSPLVEVVTEVRGSRASDNTNYDELCQRIGCR